MIHLMFNYTVARIPEGGGQGSLGYAQTLVKTQSRKSVKILAVAPRSSRPQIERLRQIEVTRNNPKLAAIKVHMYEACPEKIRHPNIAV